MTVDNEYGRKQILRDACRAVQPLFDAIRGGEDLEFRHNDDNWRTYKGCNLMEVVMSPDRFRVAAVFN